MTDPQVFDDLIARGHTTECATSMVCEDQPCSCGRSDSPTLLSLFDGAGLASLGVTEAGFQHVLGVEWDEDAADTAKAAGLPTTKADVRDHSIYAGWEGRIDLMWASPPCQDWSTAGSRAGATGDRNGWDWTLPVIDIIRPTWFLGEGVRAAESER